MSNTTASGFFASELDDCLALPVSEDVALILLIFFRFRIERGANFNELPGRETKHEETEVGNVERWIAGLPIIFKPTSFLRTQKLYIFIKKKRVLICNNCTIELEIKII
jgi:hypothetical protein